MPILLQKSFWGDERKVLRFPLKPFVCGDVRDLIVSHKNNHGLTLQSVAAVEASSMICPWTGPF